MSYLVSDALSAVTTLNQIKKLAPLFLTVLLSGCPPEPVELPGDISGTVKDAVTGESVNDAEVKLFHTNDLIETDTTGTDGTFLFTNLEPLNYSIEVHKDMYESYYGNFTVFPSTTEPLPVVLRGIPAPEFSSSLLHFGFESTQLSFSLSNAGGGILSYEIFPTHDWISVSDESGELSNESDVIEVNIQREGLEEKSYRGWIAIHSDILGEIQVDSLEIYVNYVMDQDSILYKTVRIGTQVWMAENLNTGIMLEAQGNDPTSDNGIIEKLCYDNNTRNCDVYGGLYMWAEAMDFAQTDTGGVRITQGICPDGWHIPTHQEWMILGDYLGEDLAGEMLKDTSTLWRSSLVPGTNESGFSALPAGAYQLSQTTWKAEFEKVEERAFFWTTYYDNPYWRTYLLKNYDARLFMTEFSRRISFPNAMSVRCVKDP